MTAAAPTSDAGSTAPTTPLGALSQLVQDALDAGTSLRRLGERAVDPETGEPISWQYFQKLVKNPPASPPDPRQMRALAAALNKPYRRIQEAAAKQWLQFEATEFAGYGEDVKLIVAHLAGKSPTDVRRWLRMIEAEERAIRELDE
ncbi:hypothetical protein ABZ915_17415 [Streptomyces sp. NPDC046915]|uniref:hypothetical protein n=1 Tax=Streptomyces sp. NPDC046915 TaxID=3155257 RepID=UPI0033D9077C